MHQVYAYAYLCTMVEAQELVQKIKNYVKIDAQIEADLIHVARVDHVQKGTQLVAPGQMSNRFYLIATGGVRTYLFQDGKDVTHWIYLPGTMVTSWYSYIARVPANDYLEVTDDAVLISISFLEWQKLFEKHPILERFGRLLMEEQIAMIDGFFKGYYFLSAKKKYNLLLAQFPEITQRANLGHIASMLGISQETLSRIRSK